MKLKNVLVLLAIHVAVLIACKKEDSFHSNHDAPGSGNVTGNDFGWSYTGNSVKYSGCIDSAYQTTNQGITVLAIEGTDASNNAFLLAVGSPNGNIATGTYNETQGAGMVITDEQGKTYTSKTISIKISSISSTEVVIEFSGSFTDDPTTSNTVFTISGGKLKAVIGGKTPC